MTTKTLTQNLRDLRHGIFPDAETVNAVIDQCIAQAEAMEGQAGELSQEQVDRACEVYADNHPHNGPITVNSTAMRRALASVRPSQVIGEQKPVASAPVCMGCFSQEAVCRQPGLCVSGRPKWIPSGVSPEARDRAIEALERIAAWDEHDVELAVDYGSNGVRDYYRYIARQALSALRG